MMNETMHAGQRNFPWPGMLANTPARPRVQSRSIELQKAWVEIRKARDGERPND